MFRYTSWLWNELRRVLGNVTVGGKGKTFSKKKFPWIGKSTIDWVRWIPSLLTEGCFLSVQALERETDTADLQLYESWQEMEAVWWETFKAIIRRLNLIQKTVGLSTELGKTERCNQGNRPEIEINHTVRNNCKKWDSKSKQGRR